MEAESTGTKPAAAGAEEEDKELQLAVGDRVYSVDKGPSKPGTVRYVGKVQGYDGVWAGIDWDDGLGRHDGSVNGVRYFQSFQPKSASFVRLRLLSKGFSFLQSVFRRYRSESTTQEEQDEMYVFSTTQKRVAIELVGVSKIQEQQKHLENLVHVSLAYAGVGDVESADDICGHFPNLQELDLRGNLLSDWQAIATICEGVPSLKVLNLSNNRFRMVSTELPSLCNLRTLVLNHCAIDWEQVETAKSSLPLLEELHLDGNNIQSFQGLNSKGEFEFVQGFDQLHILSVESNEIESWNEIMKLSKLSRLEQLHLNNNKIKFINYSDQVNTMSYTSGMEADQGSWMPFQNLRCLLIGGNQIDDWASVDALNSFPSLTEVRLSENPICNPSKGGASRYVLVARLAKVSILNGSEVTQRERKDSEIRYVRMVMTKVQGKGVNHVTEEHPRFEELKAFHDIPEMITTGLRETQKLASGFVSITLTYVGASSGEKPPVTKKLPVTMTVGKLKVLCDGFFKVKSAKQKLFFKEKDAPIPSLLDDDTQTLMDVGIGPNGGTILVDELEH